MVTGRGTWTQRSAFMCLQSEFPLCFTYTAPAPALWFYTSSYLQIIFLFYNWTFPGLWELWRWWMAEGESPSLSPSLPHSLVPNQTPFSPKPVVSHYSLRDPLMNTRGVCVHSQLLLKVNTCSYLQQKPHNWILIRWLGSMSASIKAATPVK